MHAEEGCYRCTCGPATAATAAMNARLTGASSVFVIYSPSPPPKGPSRQHRTKTEQFRDERLVTPKSKLTIRYPWTKGVASSEYLERERERVCVCVCVCGGGGVGGGLSPQL